jgi:hypothetical protein
VRIETACKNQNCHSAAGEESPFFFSNQKDYKRDPSALQPQDDKERQIYKNFLQYSQ